MSFNDMPAPSKENLISLSGSVEDVIYQNDENFYTVAVLDVDGDPVTIVGTMPGLRLGANARVMGEWVIHPSYGKQFKVSVFEPEIPDDAAGMLRYLSSRTIKGVGPKTAKRIVDRFGATSFDVIENSPELLSQIKGITPAKASEISRAFRDQFGLRNVILFFGEHFGPATSMKIYKQFGNGAVELVKNNPYILCDKVYGVGFERADRLAMSLGVAQDSPMRVEAGIMYLLSYNAASNGHVYLPLEKLAAASAKLLGCSEEAARSGIENLAAADRLVKRVFPEHTAVYAKKAYDAETTCAVRLSILSSVNLYGTVIGAEKLIEETQDAEGIEYAPAQKKAILSAINEPLTVITGGPGTGKTTIIKAVLRIFTGLGLKTALAAPTGRAAKRMSEATSEEAKTVHRLLEMEFSEDDEPRFYRGELTPLDYNAVIVDEVSMIDVFLFSSLLRALRPGTRLILIGDSDQLPSVGAGDVLRDIIASKKYKVCRLERIFRQSDDSSIVANAHRINRGEYPVASGKNGDFFMLERPDPASSLSAVVELCASRLPKTYGRDVLEGVQILSCTKKGELGTVNINSVLQNTLNPPAKDKPEHRSGERIFRLGDKVMQITNDYEMLWRAAENESLTGTGVFNGDIGRIISLDPDEQLLTVDFDGRLCDYDFSALDELEHAWAVTVHKSQGSEYPIVILPVFNPPPMLAARNLLYTAVTRAKKMVIIVGNGASVRRMVDNDRPAARYTALWRL
ncbi:MAG: ATP-dependent RecD-like DNA helicase [Clostridia bacterium]|nr:ATP-dependent RecD-like DNA helicase [Clostridia bacterium]